MKADLDYLGNEFFSVEFHDFFLKAGITTLVRGWDGNRFHVGQLLNDLVDLSFWQTFAVVDRQLGLGEVKMLIKFPFKRCFELRNTQL